MPELEVRNISKYFDSIRALENVSFKVKDGEYVTIVGPSGCGKSTLLRVIAGIIKPDRGEIYIGGEPVKNKPPQERGIGLVFQNILLFPHMNAWENITYGPVVKGWSDREIERIGREMMDLMKLTFRFDAYPSELSMGMQQKTALARALASGSSLLLLDEPLSALDTRVRVKLRYELREMIKELGLTAIHVTHDQEEAMSIADRMIILREGEVVEIGTPAQIYFKPRTLFTAEFIGGECNIFEGEVIKINNYFAEIETEDGFPLKVKPHGLHKGMKIVVAVKPEHITLNCGGAENTFKGEVREIDFLGSIIRYEILVDKSKLFIGKTHRGNMKILRLGKTINIGLKAQNIHVYRKQ